MRKQMANYINNAEFYQLIKNYQEETDELKKKKYYNELGKSFQLIGTNFMNRYGFINYSEDRQEEMLSEFYYLACKYLHNYDTSRNSSPFAYFTQIAFNAFVRIIKKYKLQTERYVSLEYVERGEDYAKLVDADNSDLIQTAVKSHK